MPDSRHIVCTCMLQPYRDITSALFCRLINVEILLLFLTICMRYKAEMKLSRHILNVILKAAK